MTFNASAQRYGQGTSVIGKRWTGDDVAKGVLTQGVKPLLARKAPMAGTLAPRRLAPTPVRSPIGKLAQVAKFGFGDLKAAPKVARAAFRQGSSGAAKPKMSLGAATALHRSKGLQRVGQAAKLTGENRGVVGLSTGVVGGSIMGAGLARRDEVDKAAANIVGKCETCGAKVARIFDHSKGKAALVHHMDANANYHHTPTLKTPDYTSRMFPIGKAYGDPEDARYYRLGAGSAALGAAGAGGLGYAVNDARKTSRIARAGSPMGVHNMKNVQLFVADKDEIKTKRGTRNQVNLRNVDPKAVHRADRLAQHGVAITRRGALAGAGGLAALGGAEVLRRKAHERRWD